MIAPSRDGLIRREGTTTEAMTNSRTSPRHAAFENSVSVRPALSIRLNRIQAHSQAKSITPPEDSKQDAVPGDIFRSAGGAHAGGVCAALSNYDQAMSDTFSPHYIQRWHLAAMIAEIHGTKRLLSRPRVPSLVDT